MTLTELAIHYGLDKYHSHSYMPFYERAFSDSLDVTPPYHTIKIPVVRFLEIGIGYAEMMNEYTPNYHHGGSLKMWRDFFPKAQIYGCDVHKDTLFVDDRIDTFICDQSDPISLLNAVRVVGGSLSVCVDDGSHEPLHQALTFQTLAPYMARNSLYVIEDCREPEWLAAEIGGSVYKGNKRPDDNIVYRWMKR